METTDAKVCNKDSESEKISFEYIEPPAEPECTPLPSADKPLASYIAKPEIKDFVMSDTVANSIIPPKVTVVNGMYVQVSQEKTKDGSLIVEEGYRYIMTTNEIFEKGKRGTFLATNCRPVITAFIRLYDENGKYEEFVEGVLVTDTKNLPFKVERRNYKNLFRMIREEYSEIFVAKNMGDGIESALSDTYRAAKKDSTIPTLIKVRTSGWYNIEGKIGWHTGSDDAYKNTSVPDVSVLNRSDIFNQGTKFLDVGHYNTQIAIIWLFAHAAISRWWMKQAGIDWKTALIVQGITNSFKTFTISQIANVFSDDRNDVRIPIALTTDAGGRRKLATLRGQVALIDDYSQSSKYSAERSRELAEKLIRMNGDSGGHIKAAAGSSRKTVTETIDCVLIFTAETDFGLGNSSNTRCITVRSHAAILDRDGRIVKPATFDKDVIQTFQDNHFLLKNYFASYIAFLSTNGSSLLPFIRTNFRIYRDKFNKIFQTPRMAESAAMLKIQSDLCCEFAKYSGIADTTALANYFTNAIRETITDQQEKALEFQPTILFLRALQECLEKCRVAETETDFIKGFDFVGFHQRSDDTLWLDKDWAWDTATAMIRKRGIEWLLSFDALKCMLYEQGYLYVQKKNVNGKDRITYLPRGKKGDRKSFLVVYFSKLTNLIEGGSFL